MTDRTPHRADEASAASEGRALYERYLTEARGFVSDLVQSQSTLDTSTLPPTWVTGPGRIIADVALCVHKVLRNCPMCAEMRALSA